MNRAHRKAYIDQIRRLSRPVVPVPPHLPSRFEALLDRRLPRPPRAHLFDVYGTLFSSSSGDISTSTDNRTAEAVASAVVDMTGTVLPPGQARSIATRYHETIREEHARARSEGIEHPEVDIVAIWESVCAAFPALLPASGERFFALTFELYSNPVWPMPGAERALARAARESIPGIVSNAQFYTPLMFSALLGHPLETWVREPRLRCFSFEVGRAKPDAALFAGPLAALAEQGIDSDRVAYIGNDMLNDVATAAKNGCMTVLYAGDSRSLRLRVGHESVGELAPDSVIRSLSALGTISPEG